MDQRTEHGYLVISLDFELLWGVFDVIDYRKKIDYFRSTRKVIPEILESFSRHNIQATWAVVGMLFNQNWKEWHQNLPSSLPEYDKPELSAYKFGKECHSKVPEDIVFAPELIQTIGTTIGQEIATHTYSHYYCLEQGQGLHDFRADMEKAIELAEKQGVNLKSLVFPRNQVEKNYLKICASLGIDNIRSNPSSWYWRDTLSEAFLTKAARSGDAYVPLGKKSYNIPHNHEHRPAAQPASRFFRPVESKELLRELKLRRIEQEIELAAKKNEVYHLWWHPHNFGAKPEQSLADLERILKKFHDCHEQYDFQSVNMKTMGEIMRSTEDFIKY